MRPLVAFLVAVNPPVVAAALGGRVRRSAVAGIMVAAAGAVTVAAAASGRLLDLLDVTAPTFRVATGVVLGIAAVRWLITGTPSPPDQPVSVPLPVLVLLTPQLVFVSVMVGADDGVVAAAAAGALALATAGLAASMHRPPPTVWGLTARLLGAVGIAVALAIVVDGVKSV